MVYEYLQLSAGVDLAKAEYLGFLFSPAEAGV